MAKVLNPCQKDLHEAALCGCGLRNSFFLSEPFFHLRVQIYLPYESGSPEENGIAEDIGAWSVSGFCTYTLMVFNNAEKEA